MQILASSFIDFVTWSKLSNLFEAQFSYKQSGNNNTPLFAHQVQQSGHPPYSFCKFPSRIISAVISNHQIQNSCLADYFACYSTKIQKAPERALVISCIHMNRFFHSSLPLFKIKHSNGYSPTSPHVIREAETEIHFLPAGLTPPLSAAAKAGPDEVKKSHHLLPSRMCMSRKLN